MSNKANSFGGLALKSVGGIAGVLVILAIVYFRFGVSAEPPKKEANASAPTGARTRSQKPVQTMNMALGNMVYLAQDLGFAIKTAKDAAIETGKVVVRMENQLQKIRELYRQESAKNPALVGSLLLQFNISPAGEVNQVKELSSRLNDAEFKQAIVAEVGKWSFADVVAENLKVTCPLLFVREGMDITTLVLWEKSLAIAADKPTPTRATTNATTVAKVKPEPTAVRKAAANEYQIKYPTLLRKDPNFSSASLTTFTVGTRVTVENRAGDWLEVRSAANGLKGFIRKEFIKPIEVAGK
jgi:phosphoglycolate phosphatase-like HAD superfamily hydrolase